MGAKKEPKTRQRFGVTTQTDAPGDVIVSYLPGQSPLRANTTVPAEPKKASRSGRKPGKITKCPHTGLIHFAKGMCNHCYHRFGRKGFATECIHTTRMNYAKGRCQNCYINEYNKKKRENLSIQRALALESNKICLSRSPTEQETGAPGSRDLGSEAPQTYKEPKRREMKSSRKP